MYVVVIFTSTNEVECIPSNWLISDSEAYWPNSGNCDIAHAIRTKASPDPMTWKLYAIRCLPNSNCCK